MQCFLQRHHDVGFDIASAFRHRFPLTKPAEGRATATATEKSFKEIAKTGATKFKLDAAISRNPGGIRRPVDLRPIAAVAEIRRADSNSRPTGRISGVSPDRLELHKLH